MGFWIFMLICVLILPLAMMITGLIYIKGGYPKQINDALGYRTKLSMRNQQTWEFAQKSFGKVFLIMGAVILLPSIVPMLFVIGSDVDITGWTGGGVALAQILPLLLSIIPVESAIRKNFPENGNDKNRL